MNFRFQPYVCDGCHDITQKSMSFDDTAIVTVWRNDYGIQSWRMTKGEALSKMKNTDLKEKNRQRLSRKKVNFVIMMTKNAPENKAKHKKVLRKKKSKQYHEDSKENLQKFNWYWNMPEEDKL